jgi:hypothetical protein
MFFCCSDKWFFLSGALLSVVRPNVSILYSLVQSVLLGKVFFLMSVAMIRAVPMSFILTSDVLSVILAEFSFDRCISTK